MEESGFCHTYIRCLTTCHVLLKMIHMCYPLFHIHTVLQRANWSDVLILLMYIYSICFMGNSAVGKIKNYRKNLIISVVSTCHYIIISYVCICMYALKYTCMHVCACIATVLIKFVFYRNHYLTSIKRQYFLETEPVLKLGEY